MAAHVVELSARVDDQEDNRLFHVHVPATWEPPASAAQVIIDVLMAVRARRPAQGQEEAAA